MEDAPDMKVRMPAELRARIKAAADAAGRSLNAEIRMRLEASLEASVAIDPTTKMLTTEIENLHAQVRGEIDYLKSEIEALKREQMPRDK